MIPCFALAEPFPDEQDRQGCVEGSGRPQQDPYRLASHAEIHEVDGGEQAEDQQRSKGRSDLSPQPRPAGQRQCEELSSSSRASSI